MEKFSLFDLLSFAIPGSVALVLLYWGIENTIPIHLQNLSLPEAIKAIVLLMMAYFLGHVINDLGMWLEQKLGGLPKSWVDILESNTDLAQRLDAISKKVFDISFLDEKGRVSSSKSDAFYDHAFNVLEMSGKLEKVKILQAQYVFLRNVVTLSYLGMIVFGLVFAVQIFAGKQQWSATVPFFCTMGLILCLLSARLSRRLSIKRRKMKMSATLQGFYAFYILENQLKSK